MNKSKWQGDGWRRLLAAAWACLLLAAPAAASAPVLRYFPASAIYDFRWKLLALALRHTPGGADWRLEPYAEAITQKRSMLLLESGELDVVALGSTPEREAQALPVRIDILRGIVGYRVFLIRREDQAWFDRLDDEALRRECTFGLQRDWADLPIMQAAGYRVETTAQAENLFPMLAAHRLDAFPRGLNEALHELAQHQPAFPGLALEARRALYFPFPVYFWVRRGNQELAARIHRGLEAALADGSFRRLFETTYAADLERLNPRLRRVTLLPNPNLPPGAAEPDTSWWWRPQAGPAARPKGTN